MAGQILDHPVVREDLHLIVREGDCKKCIEFTMGTVRSAKLLPRARSAGGAMVAVRDIERGNRLEGADQI